MDQFIHKTKEELIDEIKFLRNRIDKGNVVFPGLSVINKYEKQVAENEDKYKEFFFSSNDGIILLQKNVIIELNESAARLFGRTTSEIKGQQLYLFSPKIQPDGSDSRNKLIHVLHEVQNNHPAVLYWKFERGKNDHFEAEISLKQFKVGEGNFIQAIIRDITERQQLTRQLMSLEKQRIEEQFFTQSGVWEFDVKTLSLSWSKAIYYLHELDTSVQPPNLNQYFDWYIAPEDKDVFFKNIQEIIRSGKEFKMDYRIVLPGGKIKHFHVWCKPLLNEAHELIKILGNLQDITERKGLEIELLQKKESYKNLVENLPEGVIIYNNFEILYANKGAFEIASIKRPSPDEKINYRIFDFLLPQFHQEISRKIKLIMQEKKYGPVELRLKRGDGTFIEIEARSNQINYHGKQAIQVIFNDISYRKHVERSLKESERQLSTLISNLPGMAYRCRNDRDWTMEFVSEGAFYLLGYGSNELIGSRAVSFNDLIFEEDRNYVWEEIQKSIANFESFKLVYRIKHITGEIRWVFEQGMGVFDEKGELKALEGFITDITERKKAEDELVSSKETYQNLVQFLPEGVIIHQHGKVIYGNEAARKLFEFDTLDKLIGLNVFEYVLKEYHEEVTNRIKRAYLGQEQGFFDLKIRTSKGKVIDAETRSIPYLYQGQPSVLVVIHNVGQEKLLANEQMRAKLAEETAEKLKTEIQEKEKAREALLQSQSYTKNIINSSLDMIIANNSKLQITEFNRAAQIVFGYKAQDVIGKPIGFLYESEKEFLRVNKIILNEGVYTGEIRNKRKNGEVFESFLTATGLYNDEGVIIGGMGVSRDLSLVKKEKEKLRLSEERYKAILNQAFVGIAQVSLGFEFLHFNDRLLQMTSCTEQELRQSGVFELLPLEEEKRIRKLFALILKEKISNTVTETQIKSKDQGLIWVNLNLSLITTEKGRPDYYVLVFDDVSEQKLAQARMFKQTSKLNSIIENSSFMVMSVDRSLKLVTYNSSAARWIFETYGVEARQGLSMSKKPVYSNKGHNDMWNQKIKQAFLGKTVFFETESIRETNQVRSLEVYINPVFSEDQTVNEVSAICFDVTDKKKAQEKIDDQSAKLNAIFENSSHQVYTIDKNYLLTSFNQSFSRAVLTDFGVSVYVGMDMKKAIKGVYEKEAFERFLQFHNRALKGERLTSENKIKGIKDFNTYYYVYFEPIVLPDGSVNEVSYLVHDITDRKLADRKIIESLKEKEVLLKEVHHRVKNNLQVISSIINLQKGYLHDEESGNIFRELQNRIKSMSYIHESLYRTGDFNKLDFSTYVKQLAQNLKNTYSNPNQEVQLVVISEPVFLNLDYSIPCGLIINELISNAFKYAFPANKKGRVAVEIKKNGKEVILSVRDNGIGIPPEVDIFNTVTLGLQLVTSLVDQINGNLTYNKLKNGTGLTVSFNIAN